MTRKEIEVRLTLDNTRTALQKGDIIVEAEELGQVVSARPDVRGDGVMIYFMGGVCERETFGPQTLTVLRETEQEYEGAGRPLGTYAMVEISKAGGGTLGRRYAGLWSYRVTVKGKVVAEGDDLRTGTPKTHEEAARIAYGFVDDTYDQD